LRTSISDISATSSLMTGFQPSEYLISNGDTINSFKLQSISDQKISDFSGEGNSKIFTGTFDHNEIKLTKVLTINTYKDFQDWAFYKVQYINKGEKDVLITKWINHSYSLNSKQDKPDFWSLQASSTDKRKNWILPVEAGFSQENFQGMNGADYGGGIPVLDIWRKDAGIAIGHTALKPKMVSLPVKMDSLTNVAAIAIEYKYEAADILHPGDTLNTLETFVTVHKGDCFETLKQYSAFMQKQGIVMPESEPLAFEPMWCAWGYERKFTVNEIIGTFPKVKELGITWVTLDDGYQQAEGDWHTNKVKFPKGDSDMKKLVDSIHAYGFKAQLWWAPMAVDPGTKLLSEHPDLILKNADGSPRIISWWDSYYMSPAYQPVLDHTKDMVTLFMKEWGFDGLKLDGQFLNACPPDYNPAHNLTNPDDAPERIPDFFKLIYETAHQIKPAALVQFCPCGDAMSFYNMPYTNQFVASDPQNSGQVRSKCKTYKALAPNTAYFGDHVELSDDQNDFASTIGIGGVPGTKFTWPKDNPFVTEGHFVLSAEKEKEWKKWIQIYKAHILSKGEYLGGLYDIGYDIPETHVIRKSDTLFYAFYAKSWQGTLNLKGLTAKSYKVIDYANNRDLGKIKKENPVLKTSFDKYLLLMAYPD
jgi:alpha-galactosidase